MVGAAPDLFSNSSLPCGNVERVTQNSTFFLLLLLPLLSLLLPLLPSSSSFPPSSSFVPVVELTTLTCQLGTYAAEYIPGPFLLCFVVDCGGGVVRALGLPDLSRDLSPPWDSASRLLCAFLALSLCSLFSVVSSFCSVLSQFLEICLFFFFF